MCLLKKSNYFILIFLILVSCKPQGALTPERAFYKLDECFENSDAKAFASLLSKESIKKIETISDMFSKMDDDQIKSISKNYGIPEERIRKMNVEGYIEIYFAQEKRNKVISLALKQKIIGVNEQDDTAVIKVENGMELDFVKEGPYWKFNISDL